MLMLIVKVLMDNVNCLIYSTSTFNLGKLRECICIHLNFWSLAKAEVKGNYFYLL